MKVYDPLTKRTYPSVVAALDNRPCGVWEDCECSQCPASFRNNGTNEVCFLWAEKHPEAAAKVLGYVIREE